MDFRDIGGEDGRCIELAQDGVQRLASFTSDVEPLSSKTRTATRKVTDT
jgi:hypothetical protein